MWTGTPLTAAHDFRGARSRAGTLAAHALSGPGLPLLFISLYALAYTAQFPLLRWHDAVHATFASISGYRPMAAAALMLANLALLALCWRMWRLAEALPARRVSRPDGGRHAAGRAGAGGLPGREARAWRRVLLRLEVAG
jgi:hypothetical protein